MEFLLSTLPKPAADNYKKKLQKSQEFWRTSGSALSDELVAKVRALGIDIQPGKETKRKTDKATWVMEYQDDVDIPEFRELPTYKRMCVCIMKNDHTCKFMGFALNKNETQLKARAEAN